MEKHIEQKNILELRGIVGAHSPIPGSKASSCHFSLCVTSSGKDRNGMPVIETTWFNVTAFESAKVRDLDSICRGAKVHLKGTLRYQRYMDCNQIEREFPVVAATELTVLDQDVMFEFLNRIEITGTVTRTARVDRIAVETERVFRNADGSAVVEMQRHTVDLTALDGAGTPYVRAGMAISLTGKVRIALRTRPDGLESHTILIIPEEYTLLDTGKMESA